MGNCGTAAIGRVSINEEPMKKAFGLILLLLAFFVTCKKNDSNPTSSTPPTTNGTPEPTAIGTPVGPATSTTIGAAGGTATSYDGKMSVIVPAGVLVSDTTVSVQAITNNSPGGLGTAYRLGPSGMHFSSPISLQFSYPTDSVQIPELLGVAFQDTDNIWYSMPDYSVDSLTHTVAASISHFSDWTDFERVRIIPRQATLWVNQTLPLELLELPNEGTQPQPIYRVTNDQVAWSASAGTISRDPQPVGDIGAIYRAPAAIPAGNPVRVSATVNRRFTYHGTIIPTNRTTFFSYVTITDSSASYHVDVYYSNPNYMVATLPFHLVDSCSFDVLVNRTIVSVSNTTNHEPGLTPASATTPGGCTITWLPGGPGPMNIRSILGNVDTSNHVNLQFFQTAIAEEFQYACPGDPPITLGGNPTAGEPGGLSFDANATGRFYIQVSDVVDAWVTRR